jgi:hypothetical protein
MAREVLELIKHETWAIQELVNSLLYFHLHIGETKTFLPDSPPSRNPLIDSKEQA